MENAKVYVEVLVSFDKDGTMSPVEFIWEDGEKYHVDRILARERCASRKAGGVGDAIYRNCEWKREPFILMN